MNSRSKGPWPLLSFRFVSYTRGEYSKKGNLLQRGAAFDQHKPTEDYCAVLYAELRISGAASTLRP